MSLLKSIKIMLGFGLLGFVGVWIGCSSNASPVASYSASKTHTAADTDDTASPADTSPADTSPADTASPTDDLTGTPADPPAESTDNDPVTFSDESLKAAVQEALMAPTVLNLPTGPDPITKGHLKQLTKLDASNRSVKIQSLTGLEHATGLDTLILSGNSITDVTPLASLTGLKVLRLGNNRITDVDSLASLTGLKVLFLKLNRITDVTPLASLTNLEELRLYTNRITDVTPLENLTNLKKLSVGANPFGGDLSGLAENLTELEWLKVNAARVTDVTPLENLTNLKELNLSANGNLKDFSPLACLVDNLETLILRDMGHVFTAAGLIGDTDVQYLANKGVTIYR